ncbi:uncharacterized protein RAG0_06366 [Rhynchosporium agropyri]|uniref:Uncharacterized protein n=1 Tax=Rhynchosporium agropyri TaxID=914238 RepID=A0A1E1KGL2_9HELO|nr:uncharacterized protein RAG0_06366 [Rhynchosporium agropyri]
MESTTTPMATLATSSSSDLFDVELANLLTKENDTTQDLDLAILFPAITPTPWSEILKSWVKDLPADPFFPYPNVPIFDETALKGTFSKAYHPQNFIYAETPGNFTFEDASGIFTADIRIFTNKVAVGRAGGGSNGAGWKYGVGIYAKLTMRHGMEAEIYGTEDTTTVIHPVMIMGKGKGRQKDPSWKDVVSTLQSAVFKELEIQPPVSQDIQAEGQVEQHVEQPIQPSALQPETGVMAVPKPCMPQLQAPKASSVTATPPTYLPRFTPATPERIQPSQSRPLYTPASSSPYANTPSTPAHTSTPNSTQQRQVPTTPSAASIAYYNSMRDRASIGKTVPATPNNMNAINKSQIYTPPPTAKAPVRTLQTPVNTAPRTYQTPQQQCFQSATLTPAQTPTPTPIQQRVPTTPSEATVAYYNAMREKVNNRFPAPAPATPTNNVAKSQLYTPPPTAKASAPSCINQVPQLVNATRTFQTPQQQFHRIAGPAPAQTPSSTSSKQVKLPALLSVTRAFQTPQQQLHRTAGPSPAQTPTSTSSKQHQVHTTSNETHTFQPRQQQLHRPAGPSPARNLTPTSSKQHQVPTTPSAATLAFYNTWRGNVNTAPPTPATLADNVTRPQFYTYPAPYAQGSISNVAERSGTAYFESLVRESEKRKRERDGEDGQGGKKARMG